MKKNNFTYVIGIDVSKDVLDHAVLYKGDFRFHKIVANSPLAILDFVEELKALPAFKLSKAVFCMENTGIYCNHLRLTLKKLKANFTIIDALQLRRSSGIIRDKSDKLDSIRIASYAQKNIAQLRMWQPKRDVVEILGRLLSIRNRLVSVSVALRTPITAQLGFLNEKDYRKTKSFCEASRIALASDIKELDAQLKLLITSDPVLLRLQKLITSVPGIGRLTGMYIIVTTNEFRDIKDPKKFACYAGVAPFKIQSGNLLTRAKVSPVANRKMKSMLHTCATVAVLHDPEIKGYFQRKVSGGKPKMTVYNAVRNKLVLRIFACVNQRRLFQRGYVRPDHK